MQDEDRSHVLGVIVAYYNEVHHLKCQTCERSHATDTRARAPTFDPSPTHTIGRYDSSLACITVAGEVALDAVLGDSSGCRNVPCCRV